jgi:hypothetical protein
MSVAGVERAETPITGSRRGDDTTTVDTTSGQGEYSGEYSGEKPLMYWLSCITAGYVGADLQQLCRASLMGALTSRRAELAAAEVGRVNLTKSDFYYGTSLSTPPQ